MVERVYEEDVDRIMKKRKPLIAFVGHGGISYSPHPAVYYVYGKDFRLDKHVELKEHIDKLVELFTGKEGVEAYGDLPHFALVVKQFWIGDKYRKTRHVYYFPTQGKVLEEFRKLLKEDDVLRFALYFYRKYGASPNAFRIKRIPRTKTGAAVAYILHSLALAVARACGITSDNHPVTVYHENTRKRARKVLTGGE